MGGHSEEQPGYASYSLKLCRDHLPPPFEIARNGAALDHTARCWLQHEDAPAVDDLHQGWRAGSGGKADGEEGGAA